MSTHTARSQEAYDDLAASAFGTATDPSQMKLSRFAHTRFLNPEVSYAMTDDPDGTFHHNLHVTDVKGNPQSQGFVEGQPIPLQLRDYQIQALDHPRDQKVLRMARRIGKSFMMGVWAVCAALRDPTAQVLVLTPNQSHIKVLFEDYILKLLRTYRHRNSNRIGMLEGVDVADVGKTLDFAVETATKKPREIVIVGEGQHRTTIRGYVMSDSARGQTASHILMDEVDYGPTDVIEGVVDPIFNSRPGVQALIASTPTGLQDTYFYNACHSPDMWEEFHYTFEKLPHYDEDMRKDVIRRTGGRKTNKFKQEYLAEFGEPVEGVFNKRALQKSYYIAPYCKVFEEIDPDTLERDGCIASDLNAPGRVPPNRAVERYDVNVRPHPIGSQSVYGPDLLGKGNITAGTDWNDAAGMQTVIVWWPPENLLRSGQIKVARFPYGDSSGRVDTGQRERADTGTPRRFAVGQSNGDPGGNHDLSQVKGIVIWHGRLETGEFSRLSAANRVASIMSVPDFVDAWYVDKGYGDGVHENIMATLESGQYRVEGSGGKVDRPESMPPGLLHNARRFHEEYGDEDHIYKTIAFGGSYNHEDVDFTDGEGNHKDVMVNLTRQMLTAGEILIPWGMLTGYLAPEDVVGDMPVDELWETGAQPIRGEGDFGGLLSQMERWKIKSVASSSGKRRYEGPDHAIDGLMLSLLAYQEQIAPARKHSMFNREDDIASAVADSLVGSASTVSRGRGGNRPRKSKEGDFDVTTYNDEKAPLKAIREGRMKPQEAGSQLSEWIGKAFS